MDLELGTVERATNLSCKVRFLGGSSLADVRYSKVIQDNYILIQPRHVVIVDRSRSPMEVVWRAGTMATVVHVENNTVTYHVGLAGSSRSVITVPLHDGRPEAEQHVTIDDGLEVMLGPGPVKGVPAVIDIAVDGRPAHPDRFRADFPKISTRIQA
ncbi:MAG TPA: hypothetical protein VGW38_11440 [Chloroflexota bacterium]|nr:hypothetical protein [Chloroflexota bacterium]